MRWRNRDAGREPRCLAANLDRRHRRQCRDACHAIYLGKAHAVEIERPRLDHNDGIRLQPRDADSLGPHVARPGNIGFRGSHPAANAPYLAVGLIPVGATDCQSQAVTTALSRKLLPSPPAPRAGHRIGDTGGASDTGNSESRSGPHSGAGDRRQSHCHQVHRPGGPFDALGHREQAGAREAISLGADGPERPRAHQPWRYGGRIRTPRETVGSDSSRT